MIYQFIPFAAVRVMERIIGSILPGTMAMLDLEDGYMDVRNPDLTAERRSRGRKLLLDLCKQCQDQTYEQQIAMRINQVGGADFQRDLPVVRAVAETFGLADVLVPKIVSGEDLYAAHRGLKNAGVVCGSVIPMIETRKGIERIDEIVAAALELGSLAVVYGYNDYCLDAGYWPFPGSRDKLYWELVVSIAKPTLAANLRYVHPPEPVMHDEKLLSDMIVRLRSICGEHFDVFSAGMSQTPILRQLVGQASHDEQIPSTLNEWLALEPSEQRRLADETCELFENNQREEHSFSADPRKGRFITPHEYLAAMKYLNGSRYA